MGYYVHAGFNGCYVAAGAVAAVTGGLLLWLDRRGRRAPWSLPVARGKDLDRLALDRCGMRREGWREKLPLGLGDRAFRRRIKASAWPRMKTGA